MSRCSAQALPALFCRSLSGIVVGTRFGIYSDADTGLKEVIVKTVPAQEIKRRGLAAVDGLLDDGDVHVIRNNRLQYVVLTEERYQHLIAEAQEAYLARVRTSLQDVKEGRVRGFATADDLLQALDEDE